MHQQSQIVLGLLRRKGVQIDASSIFVYTNPEQSTILREGDRVFFLSQTPPAIKQSATREVRGDCMLCAASRIASLRIVSYVQYEYADLVYVLAWSNNSKSRYRMQCHGDACELPYVDRAFTGLPCSILCCAVMDRRWASPASWVRRYAARLPPPLH